MSSSFFKSLNIFILVIMFLIIFISCFFSNSFSYDNLIFDDSYYDFSINNSDYLWPTPGYTTITSYFGNRYSPTAGASSYHKGLDIGAPEGSKLIAITDGKITFTGFLGGGGYTITLSINNMKITYCHVSPNYIVKKGDIIKKGQVIGFVGPKNVYGVDGNQYKDENGNPTNGATTGPHLHLGVRINNEYINPLNLYN